MYFKWHNWTLITKPLSIKVHFLRDPVSPVCARYHQQPGVTRADRFRIGFAKAFDKVPHRRLLHKLDYYGIRRSNSWLSGRTQQVVLDGQASDPVPVLSGVSQGSDKYLTPARSLKSTRSSHSAQYCRYQTYSDALKNSFFPGLFHSGIVFLLQWSIPRLLRSLGHSSWHLVN